MLPKATMSLPSKCIEVATPPTMRALRACAAPRSIPLGAPAVRAEAAEFMADHPPRRLRVLQARPREVGEIDEEIGALLGLFSEPTLMCNTGGTGVDRFATALGRTSPQAQPPPPLTETGSPPATPSRSASRPAYPATTAARSRSASPPRRSSRRRSRARSVRRSRAPVRGSPP
jgi:hypothetical protein